MKAYGLQDRWRIGIENRGGSAAPAPAPLPLRVLAPRFSLTTDPLCEAAMTDRDTATGHWSVQGTGEQGPRGGPRSSLALFERS